MFCMCYLGHSLFTVRSSSDTSSSSTKYVSDVEITSEQCDDAIQHGLPTTETFKMHGYSYFVECLYGDNDKCQVYKQFTHTFNLKNMNVNNTRRRRLQRYTERGCYLKKFEITEGFGSSCWDCRMKEDDFSYGIIYTFSKPVYGWPMAYYFDDLTIEVRDFDYDPFGFKMTLQDHPDDDCQEYYY